MSALVRYAVDGPVASLTLDSPHNRNALSHRLVTELLEGLDRAEADDSVKAMLVRAEGRVFCSGADLTEATDVGMSETAHQMVELQRRILASAKPVVARIQGAVRAGGLGVVAAADIAVTSSDATFALTEVRLGLAPAVISLTVLPRLTSRAASAAFLTGEPFDAAQAVRTGLVTTAVAAADLDQEVERVLAAVCEGHPQGLREAKRLANADILARVERDGRSVADLSGRLFGSEAAQEAMRAFLTRAR